MLTSRPSKHNVFLPTTSRSKHNVFLPTSPSKHTSDFRHYIIHFRITSFLLTDSLLLGSLLSSLGNLTGLVGLLNSLDDTNSNGLSHVSDSESTQWWVVGESFNTHWLGWDHLDDSSVTRLDELSSNFLPVLLSIFSIKVSNLQAM